MSVAGAAADVGRLSRPRPEATGRAGASATAPRTGVAPTVAFAASALIASLRFGSLLRPVPALAAIGIAAVATGAAVALQRLHRYAEGGRVAAASVAVVVVAAALGFIVAGASVSELSPVHWGRFGHDVARGLGGLDGHWPYEGAAVASRTAVLLGSAVVLIACAGLAFWPTREYPGERVVAVLALLLILYTSAAVNEPAAGWPLQGLLVCAAAWLWVTALWPPSRPAPARRMGAWIALATLGGIGAAAALQSSTPLVSYHDWNPFAGNFPASSFDWNQQYGPLDPKHLNEAMFSVRSGTPRLWRVTTLDRFDGVGFVSSPPPPGEALTTDQRGTTTRARFTIQGLHSTELLSPGQATAVTLHGVSIPTLLPFSSDGTISVAGPPPTSGDTYTVTAFVADSTPRVLAQAPPTVPAALQSYTDIQLPDGDIVSLARPTVVVPRTGLRGEGGSVPTPVPGAGVGLQSERLVTRGDSVSLLPGSAVAEAQQQVEQSPYAGVLALAQRLAAGAHNNYEVIARVDSYLRDNFVYSTSPKRSTYPLVSFLLHTHLGYCQQFSGAMALLLRLDGIPARVAAGFQTGSHNSSGEYAVTGRDAHEWVEAYFSGVGWVSFDPTPPAASSALPIPAGLAADPDAVAGAATGLTGGRSTVVRRRDIGLGQTATTAHGRSGGGAWWLAAALILVGLACAGGLTFLLAVRRRPRRDPITELTDALAVVGFALSPSMTLAELEPRLVIHYGPDAGAYAALLRRQRYSTAETGRGPSAGDRRRLRRRLAAHRGLWLRLRLLVALPPAGLRA